jgi:SAM-dependent methyltransferase
MSFENVYEDSQRADSYARLEFPGTYYLAYRDLPQIIAENVTGKRALDFGCGTGRSTRFLKKLGFNAVGVDISSDMLARARTLDPNGDYRQNIDGGLSIFGAESFDLVLSAFTFDNIPTAEKKLKNFMEIKNHLAPKGKMINLVSAPEIYINEWASFTTRDFPENRHARSGDKVKIIMTDVDDRRPVEDILWTDPSYRQIYDTVGLKLLATFKPLARDDEPYKWVNETQIAPWVIYLLGR